jgi:hypothetical protein
MVKEEHGNAQIHEENRRRARCTGRPCNGRASDKPKTREQRMDEAAARDFAQLDRVNQAAKQAAFRIMNERGPAVEPQPSSGTERWRGHIGVDGPIVSAAGRMRGW